MRFFDLYIKLTEYLKLILTWSEFIFVKKKINFQIFLINIAKFTSLTHSLNKK